MQVKCTIATLITVFLIACTKSTPTAAVEQIAVRPKPSEMPLEAHVNHKILEGAHYRLVTYKGKAFDAEVTMVWDSYDNMRLKFCNQLTATVPYMQSEAKSKQGVVGTRMACENQQLMQIEVEFGNALSDGMTLKVEPNNRRHEKLTFTTKQGVVYVFAQEAMFIE